MERGEACAKRKEPPSAKHTIYRSSARYVTSLAGDGSVNFLDLRVEPDWAWWNFGMFTRTRQFAPFAAISKFPGWLDGNLHT